MYDVWKLSDITDCSSGTRTCRLLRSITHTDWTGGLSDQPDLKICLHKNVAQEASCSKLDSSKV